MGGGLKLKDKQRPGPVLTTRPATSDLLTLPSPLAAPPPQTSSLALLGTGQGPHCFSLSCRLKEIRGLLRAQQRLWRSRSGEQTADLRPAAACLARLTTNFGQSCMRRQRAT